MYTRNLRNVAIAAVALAVVGGVGAAQAVVATSSPSSYTAQASTRVLDTRTTHSPLAAGQTLPVSVGTPDGATAVTVNITVTAPTGGGYVLAYADGTARPNPGSTVNFGAGQTVANETTVPVTNGKIDLYNGSTGSVQLIVDVEGYYTAASTYTPPATVTASANTGANGQTIATGGSARTNATDVVQLALTAGTYQVSVNAKATPIVQLSAGQPTGVQVFPQFFVYNGALDPTAQVWWSNNLFNVGSGALESGQYNNIDSYYSGSGLVTVPTGGETLHVYAFGYDSDRGAGSYILDSLTVTAVPVSVQ